MYKASWYLPGPHHIPVHSSVSLIALDGCKVFFIGPFIDIRLTLHVALTFISVGKKKTSTSHVSSHRSVGNLKAHSAAPVGFAQVGVMSFLLCYLPQPFAHDCLKELPGRDLAQDFPITVCKDGISVAFRAKNRKWTVNISSVITQQYS